MGLEFAIVHQDTREAYDLGKWCYGSRDDGSSWKDRMPVSRDEVRLFFAEYYEEKPHLIEPTTDDVWAFIATHPGCRIVSEHDDVSWRTKWPDPDAVATWGEENCFRQVASRYDVEPRVRAHPKQEEEKR